MEIILRDYQIECVNRVLACYSANPSGQELLVLPTGSGKTVIFCQVIDSLNKQHGLNTLIIAHRDELLDQATDKYRMVKPNAIIGKVGSGRHEYGGEVTCASIATISRPEHIKRLKAIGYGLIIVDEAHHVAADGYQRVLEALPEAFTLMVTATMDRMDGKPIIDHAPLYSASIIDMIQQGYLCDLKAIAIKTETSLDGLHTSMGDFKSDELEEAIDTRARNQRVVEAYKEHANGRRAACFAVSVKHAWNLSAAFKIAGIPAGVISGDTPLEQRHTLYQQFHSGEVKILCTVNVLTEGWDEPLCDCIIMARPTQSRALYVQSIGRGLRLAPAKENCIVLDLTDNCLTHRLEPQRLAKVLELPLEDDETVLEAKERLEEEAKEQQVRKLTHRRDVDITLDLTAKLTWQLRDDGKYVMTIGPEKHRIALVPVQDEGYDLWGHVGYYKVLAKLAPRYEAQVWSNPLPLDFAQQEAEKKARLLLADPKNLKLVDRYAPWRGDSATEVQLEKIAKYKAKGWIKADIPVDEDGNYILTKGEAGDLLEPVFEMFKRWDEQRKGKQIAV